MCFITPIKPLEELTLGQGHRHRKRKKTLRDPPGAVHNGSMNPLGQRGGVSYELVYGRVDFLLLATMRAFGLSRIP